MDVIIPTNFVCVLFGLAIPSSISLFFTLVTLRAGDDANVSYTCVAVLFKGSTALQTTTLVCCIELHTAVPISSQLPSH